MGELAALLVRVGGRVGVGTVSEQPPEGRRDGGQSGQRPQGKKILGLPRNQAIGLGLLGLGGLAFLLWRARQNAKKAAQQQAASPCPDGSTPDANGNCPQNSQDWSGAIDTLQSEIAALQGAQGGGGSGGGGSAGGVAGSTGTPTTDGGTTGATVPAPSGTPLPGPAPRPAAAAGPIAGLQITSTGTTGFAARWDPAQGATGGYQYIVRDLATHQQVGAPHHTSGTIAVVSGLKSKTDYNLGVQGLPGGPGANVHVRTK